MMPALTRQVMSDLTRSERILLTEILDAAGERYDDTTAIPNIEHISDFATAHWIDSLEPRVRR